ncbi:MAG: hypothetical protein ABSE48_01385 [Verrucomicrobiota bacterium]|jgi:hypothetical protein
MKIKHKQTCSRLIPAVWTAIACALLSPASLKAQANMRREGALTLNQTSDDNHGFYAATIDPGNGFAYFAAKYVYKVNLTTPLPTQVGAGVSIGKAYSGAMDSSAGCAYFDVGGSLYQILANGANAPTLGAVMTLPFSSSAFLTQLLIDTSDPANHYLYVMTTTGNTSSTLYKLALNNFGSSSAIIGSATTTAQQPALGFGVIDLTNHCAYYGSFIPTTQPPYIAKFALGSGSSSPTNLGGVFLDTTTNRSVGGIVLDIANGYGYCASDGNDLFFGHGRVYKWALNGLAAPALVSYVDMHTNEGYCHVAVIKPANRLLYFSDDLSYPAHVFRYRLPPGTNAPVETGALPLLDSTNTVVPAWGYNPTNASNWGEVFARSIAYDPGRDFVYIGRDDADEQVQPYTDQIVKVALDREETLIALTEDGLNTNNTIPYAESFESYTNGFSIVGTNGWYAEDAMMAVVVTNNYTYTNAFPIPGSHQLVLQVDGAVTNRFSPSANSDVWLDMMLQAKYWTDPIQLTLSNTPVAMCISTNGCLSVWNCTNPPAPGNGWTELLDTSIASNQFFRVTLEINYNRDTNGEYYYRVWVNGTASVNPQTWYATADTNQNHFGDVLAQGHFALDDFVVTVPVITFTNLSRNPNGNINLFCHGMPGLIHRISATMDLSQPEAWQVISTNQAGADGAWQFTDTNAVNHSRRFYRASLP